MLLIVGLVIFLIFLCLLFLVSPMISPRKLVMEGAHVLVTGGSSGIGKEVAMEAARRGANVTLLARDQKKLAEAKTLVMNSQKSKDTQKCLCISVDLSKDYSSVEKAIKQAEEMLGPVDMLINSAGYSVSGRFEDIPNDDFRKLMEINYFGSINATKAIVPSMKERQKGRIVFVSSQAGQVGLFGFTAYSASKFALRGLAESLAMEVKPYNVYVSLAFPPDTDTPGYEEEMKSKPKETRLLSETAGLFQPEYVAKSIVKDSIAGKFLIYVGLDGFMLGNLTCGMSPVGSVIEATQQVAVMGLFRAISLVYLRMFDKTVSDCKKERDAAERPKSD